MKALQTPLSALLLASLASCNALKAPSQPIAQLDPMAARFSVTAFHEDSQLDQVKFNDPSRIQETRKDVDRRRSGVRASGGIEYAQAYVEAFGTEHLGEEVDSFGGVGFGAQADINLHRFDNGATLFLPYRAGVSLAGGDDDFGDDKTDFATLELISELGLGVDFRGFRPSFGVMHKRLRGELDFDDDPGDESDLRDITGDYLAGYVELAYVDPGSPFQAAVRGVGGDEEGVYFSVGIHF